MESNGETPDSSGADPTVGRSGAGQPADGERTELARLRVQLERARSDARSVAAQNDKLTGTLREARAKLLALKAQLDTAAEPPNNFGVLAAVVPTPTTPANPEQQTLRVVDVWSQGRKVRTTVHEDIDDAELRPGTEVLLDETQSVVGIAGPASTGEVMKVKDLYDDERVVATAHNDDEQVIQLGVDVDRTGLRPGDLLMVDRRSLIAIGRVPRLESQELVLEEVPDISYTDIGGLTSQIEQIHDAIELPFLHRELYADYDLVPPKGILLYGPPGCGKTMIAKAVANSLATRRKDSDTAERADGGRTKSYFLNVKGPELLNKYVGETERQIRQIFLRAREKAARGNPVIIFFDEMDSMFRTRGTGVSSDVENTIVPQLLAEIDGVEVLEDVVIIGASNREDMIDPAILRPGRLDVKVRIDRPDAEAAAEIFAKYLTDATPLHAEDLAANGGDPVATRQAMVERVVEHMYATTDDTRFLEVSYAGGDSEIMYFKDFASGAMIANIVGRAKKAAIKEFLAGGSGGVRVDHLTAAAMDEFAENEDLPNTTNPDDWAKISGKKGQQIIGIRPLFTSKRGTSHGGDRATGQYL